MTSSRRTMRQVASIFFFKKIKNFFPPRYKLHLDESCLKQIDLKKYRLKVFGGQGYIVVSYDQILGTPNLCCDIVPQDLMKIAVHHYEHRQLEKKTSTLEILPNEGGYKVSFDGNIRICSGEEIISNRVLLNGLSNLVVAAIAYQEGLNFAYQDTTTRQNAMSNHIEQKIVYLKR